MFNNIKYRSGYKPLLLYRVMSPLQQKSPVSWQQLMKGTMDYINVWSTGLSILSMCQVWQVRNKVFTAIN